MVHGAAIVHPKLDSVPVLQLKRPALFTRKAQPHRVEERPTLTLGVADVKLPGSGKGDLEEGGKGGWKKGGLKLTSPLTAQISE